MEVIICKGKGKNDAIWIYMKDLNLPHWLLFVNVVNAAGAAAVTSLFIFSFSVCMQIETWEKFL